MPKMSLTNILQLSRILVEIFFSRIFKLKNSAKWSNNNNNNIIHKQQELIKPHMCHTKGGNFDQREGKRKERGREGEEREEEGERGEDGCVGQIACWGHQHTHLHP